MPWAGSKHARWYIICGLYVSTFSFLIPPQNWIYLRLPLLHCDSRHIGEDFPPSSETHVNKWAEVSRVTRGRTSPSSIQKDEKRKWAWCNIRCHVQQKPPCTHTQSNITECQRRVSVSTSGWGKEITLPVAQILNEWKFDWNDFPICVFWADWRT